MVPEDFLPDDRDDDIGRLLGQASLEPRWNGARRRLIEEATDLAQARGYIKFWADPYRYLRLLDGVGMSWLYPVPAAKRGHLSAFQGRLVRIFCIGSGTWTRTLMAGPVEGLSETGPGGSRVPLPFRVTGRLNFPPGAGRWAALMRPRLEKLVAELELGGTSPPRETRRYFLAPDDHRGGWVFSEESVNLITGAPHLNQWVWGRPVQGYPAVEAAKRLLLDSLLAEEPDLAGLTVKTAGLLGIDDITRLREIVEGEAGSLRDC